MQCLQAHIDVFTWSHDDMQGINPKIACHRLTIKNARSTKQKIRCFNQERYESINNEVEKLLKAGFIREVNYLKWISNIVLVKKANGKWRMCIDFIDFNRVWLKESFSSPKINQLIDSTIGHSLLNFMDAFSKCNQIPMFEQDEEYIAFITNQGLLYYMVMSFVLKNANATY